MKSMKQILFAILILGTYGIAFSAAPPDLINYQGVLRDDQNQPFDGVADMIFRFYDALAGGNEILVDSHLAAGTGGVTVTGGLFNVHLGSGAVTDGSGPGTYTTLTEVFRAFGDVYMEVQVEGETLSPRTRVVSSAYAMNPAAGTTVISDTSGTAVSESADVSIAPDKQYFVTVTADAVSGFVQIGVVFDNDTSSDYEWRCTYERLGSNNGGSSDDESANEVSLVGDLSIGGSRDSLRGYFYLDTKPAGSGGQRVAATVMGRLFADTNTQFLVTLECTGIYKSTATISSFDIQGSGTFDYTMKVYEMN